MQHLKKTFQTSGIFYGWYIVASSFFILFFNAGARFSFGVMFKPMIADFGWSRATISLVFFLNMTFYAFSLIVAGRLYDRYGPKWVIVISTAIVSTGFMLTAVINALWQFFVFYGVVAAIGLGGPSVSLMAAITSKWFERWRGLAISIALTGSSLGQFVLVPLITIVTLRHGWRSAYLSIGLIMLVVNILIALLVMRGDPDALGQGPLGYRRKKREEVGGEQHRLASKGLRDLGLRDAMHTRSFWLFIIVMFVCGSGDFLVATHLIPFVTDFGISPVTAGSMLGWFGLMSLAGLLVAGPVSDMIGNKMPIALTFLLRFFLYLLILKYQTLGSFYCFAFGFGFTLLITAPLTTTLMGKLYGLAHVGLITGVITTVHHVGGGFWAYMGGVIFDRTGSYQIAFVISAIMALAAFFSSIFIIEKRHRVVSSGIRSQ
jgi:MFS family permease